MVKRISEKSNNITLYKKYKQNLSSSIKKEDILAARPFRQGYKNYDSIKKSLEEATPVFIVVSGLFSCSGCTFISNKFAEYLRSLNYSVLLVRGNNDQIEFSRYNFIIIDAGRYKDIPKAYAEMVLKAHIKIMVCQSSETYLKELSLFIKTEPNSEQWAFLYNKVSNAEHKELSELMEEYEYFMVPELKPDDIEGEKELRNSFKTIILARA